jgi:hypothetical protein
MLLFRNKESSALACFAKRVATFSGKAYESFAFFASHAITTKALASHFSVKMLRYALENRSPFDDIK